MLFIPKGIAHGFLSLKDDTILNYKCDEFYKPDFESGFNLFDNELNFTIPIPKEKIIISEKDLSLPKLKDSYFFD